MDYKNKSIVLDLDGVIAGLRSDKAIEAANNVELLRPDDKR